MFRLSFGRPALVLALVFLFVAPREATAGPRLGGARHRAAFSDSAPDVFSGFLSFVARLWEKAGCILDPSGQCAPIQVDAGCGIDPHGGCLNGQ